MLVRVRHGAQENKYCPISTKASTSASYTEDINSSFILGSSFIFYRINIKILYSYSLVNYHKIRTVLIQFEFNICFVKIVEKNMMVLMEVEDFVVKNVQEVFQLKKKTNLLLKKHNV